MNYKELTRNDGIDVSGCIHKKNDACMAITNFCGEFKHYCDDLNDCYYKQLKRKEQECETLASQLDFEVQKKECLEQECERLKNIINVAKNSKLDLKSFLVGEAVQNEYEEQLEAYKMEAEEGKEINAELKATNEDLLSIQYKLADNNKQLRQTLTEIKEILIKTPTDSREHFLNAKSVILQICDEVNDV